MIRLENLSRVFNVGDQEVRALDAINLHVLSGEYLSIMGPSGSGKSTLLNILGLLDRPSGGRYLLDKRDVTSLSERHLAEIRGQRIGFVFQFFHLVPRLTAQQNIELPLMLAGVPAPERSQRSRKLLEAFGLEQRGSHRSDELSGGQRQRVAIARAIINRPAVLLADEPTGNLDQASGAEIIKVIEQLNEEGLTLIIVTHDQKIGERASRRVRFVDGRIKTDERDS